MTEQTHRAAQLRMTMKGEWQMTAKTKTPADYGIGADVDPDVAEAMVELIENGLIVDSGKRRNGRIVWVAVPETKN
jgi:hypothetical protein